MSKPSKKSTSDRVIHESKGWGKIIGVGLLVFLMLPAIAGALPGFALGQTADTARNLTKPLPARAQANPSTPTVPTAAPSGGQPPREPRPYGPANGTYTPPTTPQPKPGKELPQLGEAPSGGPLGALLPGVGGVVQALGPALKALPK